MFEHHNRGYLWRISFVRIRFAHSLGLGVLVAGLVSGCTFSAEIANLEPYDPSDGV